MDVNDEIDKIENEINMYTNISQNYKIKGDEGFQYLVIKLGKNENIIANTNVIFIKGNYSINNVDNTVFKLYKGIDDGGCSIAFNSLYNNSIVKISVYRDEVQYVTKYCILAYTDNILVENHLNIIYSKNPNIETAELFDKIINSFKNPKTQQFIHHFLGNNGLSKTELETVFPIYLE